MGTTRFAVAVLVVALTAVGNAGGEEPLPTSAEPDACLHADGKGWRLDKAKIVCLLRP